MCASPEKISDVGALQTLRCQRAVLEALAFDQPADDWQGRAVNVRRESGGEFVEIVVEPYPVPISYRGHYSSAAAAPCRS